MYAHKQARAWGTYTLEQRQQEYRALRAEYVRELEEFGAPYGRGFLASHGDWTADGDTAAYERVGLVQPFFLQGNFHCF